MIYGEPDLFIACANILVASILLPEPVAHLCCCAIPPFFFSAVLTAHGDAPLCHEADLRLTNCLVATWHHSWAVEPGVFVYLCGYGLRGNINYCRGRACWNVALGCHEAERIAENVSRCLDLCNTQRSEEMWLCVHRRLLGQRLAMYTRASLRLSKCTRRLFNMLINCFIRVLLSTWPNPKYTEVPFIAPLCHSDV